MAKEFSNLGKSIWLILQDLSECTKYGHTRIMHPYLHPYLQKHIHASMHAYIHLNLHAYIHAYIAFSYCGNVFFHDIKMTNTRGAVTEAKSINLSLHYLEQVIVSLREHAVLKRSRANKHVTPLRGHVPYRNSILTSILRDR